MIIFQLTSPTRQFPPKSRANGVRETLRYGNKPYWPMQWYMVSEKVIFYE